MMGNVESALDVILHLVSAGYIVNYLSIEDISRCMRLSKVIRETIEFPWERVSISDLKTATPMSLVYFITYRPGLLDLKTTLGFMGSLKDPLNAEEMDLMLCTVRDHFVAQPGSSWLEFKPLSIDLARRIIVDGIKIDGAYMTIGHLWLFGGEEGMQLACIEKMHPYGELFTHLVLHYNYELTDTITAAVVKRVEGYKGLSEWQLNSITLLLMKMTTSDEWVENLAKKPFINLAYLLTMPQKKLDLILKVVTQEQIRDACLTVMASGGYFKSEHLQWLLQSLTIEIPWDTINIAAVKKKYPRIPEGLYGK